MTAPPASRASRRDWIVAVLVVMATGVASTWPLATSPWLVPDHQDPLFSVWRLYTWTRNLAAFGADGWFAGNQFHPAPAVLLYSDAVPLPALVGAPFVFAGVPVVLVYNGLVWLAILSAGLAMYACARYLSSSHWGALVAAVMFIGAPLRLDHVMHLELLWSAFLPLTVLATARAFDGSIRGAWGIGASVAAQFLSCIYYGVFLLTLWPLLAGIEWLRRRGRVAMRSGIHAGAGLALAGVVAGTYARPYLDTRQVVGERGDRDVADYSGGFDSYALSPAQNRLWGWTHAAGVAERWLFPGLIGSALAVSAVTTPAAPWVAAIAATGLVAADASRGSSGLVYPLFRRFLSPYRGLRVPARFGMLTLTMLALLAAIGAGTMGRTFGGPARAGVVAALVLLLMGAETLANVPVRQMPQTAPPIYAFLGTLPPTVIAHLPLPPPERLPGPEADFIYFAQYHRHRIVNGNSGFYPPAYLRLVAETREPAGNRALAALRAAGVDYLLVHERYFQEPGAYGAAIFHLEARDDLDPVGTWADEPGRGDVRVYRLRRQ